MEWEKYCILHTFFSNELPKNVEGSFYLIWFTKGSGSFFDESIQSVRRIPEKNFMAFSSHSNIHFQWEGAFQGITFTGLISKEFSRKFLNEVRIFAFEKNIFHRLCESKKSLSIAEQSALAYEVLTKLSLEFEKKEMLPFLVLAAIEEIHLHYPEVYGIEELAINLEVSKSHLIRIFHQHQGITPGKYLLNVRLEAAKRYLQNNFSLELTAAMSGFSSASYFCKVFKKEIGETPIQWKKFHSSNKISLSDEINSSLQEEMLLY